MDKKAFGILRQIAADSFSEPYAGLQTMLRTNKQFAKFVEKNYRIKKFNEEHSFYLTRNEIDFHFIGFMDAILWLSRSNMLKRKNAKIVGEDDYDDSDDDYELDEEELKIIKQSELEEKAVWNYISCYETGEDWSFDG